MTLGGHWVIGISDRDSCACKFLTSPRLALRLGLRSVGVELSSINLALKVAMACVCICDTLDSLKPSFSPICLIFCSS